MEKIKLQWVKWRKLAKDKPVYVWVFIATLTLIAAFTRESGNASQQVMVSHDDSSVDTFIPAGFVLVPIEVVNYESLDSVLGRYGVVDLFATDPVNGGRSNQVASRIRILRAPRNPNQFAVLAPESESARLVSHSGGFYVIVQNPKSDGTTFEKPSPKKTRRSRLLVEMNDE